MSRLILHIGAPKCGSTTIQDFLSSFSQDSATKMHFEQVDPKFIDELNIEVIDSSTESELMQYLSSKAKKSEIVVLSHEYFFICPHSIKHICKLACKIFSSTKIFGVCRRPGDWVESAYSQWVFRDPAIVDENKKIIEDHGLSAAIFSGKESHLIAKIMSNFDMKKSPIPYILYDWKMSCGHIKSDCLPYEAELILSFLPTKKHPADLLASLMSMCSITCDDPNIYIKDDETANPKFNDHLIEAVYHSSNFNTVIPVHSGNDLLGFMGSRINNELKWSSGFIGTLKEFIDSTFLKANNEFASEFNIPMDYFSVTKPALTREEMISLIHEEADKRLQNSIPQIEYYQKLSAAIVALCYDLCQESATLRKEKVVLGNKLQKHKTSTSFRLASQGIRLASQGRNFFKRCLNAMRSAIKKTKNALS